MKNRHVFISVLFMSLFSLILSFSFGLHTIEAAELTSSEPPVWKGNVNVGANLQSGNTDRFNAAVGADALRKSAQDRYSLNFLFNYSKEDSTKTAESYYGAAKYDYFFTSRLYGYLSVEMLKDKFKDLSLRTVIGPGAGYQVWDEEKKSLSVEGGLAYFSDNYIDAEDDDWITARLAGLLRYEILSSMTFTDHLIIYPSLEEFGDFQLRNEAAITTPLASGWAIRFANILEYNSAPPGDIKDTDINWILTMQYSF